MAGHIAGLGYSQRSDANGRPLSGCKLYIYTTGTSSPVTTYSDYALSLALSHPMVADSSGIIPMFWVDDGTYRVRLTDADGNEIFDDDGIVAIGPSSGSSGGTSVDSNAIAATGDFNWQPVSGTRSGWVRANARTIGSAASGGTERANADCENLFLFLWNTFSDSLCPVTGGRGGSAAADWAANKVIATLDMRAKTNFGLNDMGNSSASFTGGTTSAAAALGASTFTIASANLPNTTLTHTLAVQTTFSLSVGTGITNGASVTRGGGGFAAVTASGSKIGFDDTPTSDTLSLASGTVSGTAASSIAGNISLGGSGDQLTILPPSRAGTWYIRL